MNSAKNENKKVIVSADYAARINSLRSRMMLNQSAMAKRLKATKSDISRWENATHRPSMEQWARFLSVEENFNEQENRARKSRGIPEAKIAEEIAPKAYSMSPLVSGPSSSDGNATSMWPDGWQPGDAYVEESCSDDGSCADTLKHNNFDTSRVNSEKSIGDMIRDFRSKFGYSQVKFGSIVGVTGSTVCQYESGTCSPSPSRWDAIVSAASSHGFDIISGKKIKSSLTHKDNTMKQYSKSENNNTLKTLFVPIDFQRQISSFISRYSKTHGMTCSTIAEHVGVSAKLISEWVGNASSPTKEQWRKFCKMRRIFAATCNDGDRSIHNNISISEIKDDVRSKNTFGDMTTRQKFLLADLLEMLADLPVRDIQSLSEEKRAAFWALISK